MNWTYLLQSLEHHSPAQVAGRYAYRGLNRVMDLELWYGYCLTKESSLPLPDASLDLAFGFLDEPRLRAETSDPHSGLDPEGLERSLREGERCYGAVVGGVLACHIWFSREKAHLSGNVYARFSPRYAFARWAFTRPQFRGLHLHARCKRSALAAYAAQGCRGILSVVSAINFDSIKSAERVGCTRTGLLFMTGVGSRAHLWASPGCERFGLRLEQTGPARN